MRESRVKEVWSHGHIAVGSLIKSTDPVHTEVISQLGLDFIWLDLEHSDKSVETFAQLTRAARIGTSDIMARPAGWEYMRMGRMLEAGAHGILYPRCESAEEVAEVVKWAKFHPLGERGFDGGSADNNYGQYPADFYTAEANAQTWIAIQIESPRAVDRAREIAAVDGVDCVFVGPGDFSALNGRARQVQGPETLRVAETIAKATEAAGKIFGTLVFDMDHARLMKSYGARLLAHGADVVFLKAAYQKLINDYAELREDN